MKTILLFLLLLFNFSYSIDGLSPQIPGDYQIAPWYDFKESAITYSFDDGSKNQYEVALPLLDKYDLKASFNLITSWPQEWEGYKKAAKNGHEISSHTINHPNLKEEDKETQEKELLESKEYIEEKIGEECVTLVYPYCVPAEYDISKKYYISGRSCSGKYISPNPEDMFDLSSIGVGSESEFQTAEDLNKHADKALDEGKWLIFLLHGIDNDGGYSPLDSQELESHLIYVKELDKWWISTFRDISKYILEANSLIIKEKEGKDSIEISVSCSYETDITKLDVPVTVSRILEDEELKTAKIILSKDKSKVKTRISGHKIIFDVIPGQKYLLQLK